MCGYSGVIAAEAAGFRVLGASEAVLAVMLLAGVSVAVTVVFSEPGVREELKVCGKGFEAALRFRK